MPHPNNPNFCCGCAFWNYQCVAPEDQPCANVTTDRDFIRTAHTKKDVNKAIRQTKHTIIKKKIRDMLTNKKKLLLLPLLFVLAGMQDMKAQTESISVFFRTGQATIDTEWLTNGVELPNFIEQVHKTTQDTMLQVDSVVIRAYTSPEGMRHMNDAISIRRADAIKEFLTRNLPALQNIKSYPAGEDWIGFAEYLSRHPEVPRAKEMKTTIEQVSSAEQRKVAVMNLLTPEQWEDLKITAFPELRRTDITLYWTKKAITGNIPDKSDDKAKAAEKEKEEIKTPQPEQEKEKDYITTEVIQPQAETTPKEYSPTAVIGTNVLLDVFTVPNLSLEFPFGKHWSVGGAFLFPAWKDWTPWWDKNQKPYSIAQVLLANIQLSYYFIPWREGGSRVLRGPYLRLFGYTGAYTFEHRTSKEEGILDQGNYFATGLSLGAAIPLGKWVRLDFSAGFGPSWTMNSHYINYSITGDPILVGKTTTMKWKAADAQVGVKYIFHKKVQKE